MQPEHKRQTCLHLHSKLPPWRSFGRRRAEIVDPNACALYSDHALKVMHLNRKAEACCGRTLTANSSAKPFSRSVWALSFMTSLKGRMKRCCNYILERKSCNSADARKFADVWAQNSGTTSANMTSKLARLPGSVTTRERKTGRIQGFWSKLM